MAIKFYIGSSECVVIEKWQQMKNDKGSLTDTLVNRYTAFANVDNKRGMRVFDGQLKQATTFDMVVRKKILDARDINVTWKVVYQGHRHSVINKVCINKKNSDFLLTVEVK